MSAPVTGKFQDHYIVLGIDPQADSDTIQAAYAKLAEKYQPNNPETGDEDKFEILNLAYEVLSDPTLRAGFDKVKGVDQEHGGPKFSGESFFDAIRQGAVLRSAVLCVLYDRRRLKSFKPSLSIRNLENMLHVNAGELNFALWYLKQRGLVVNDDKSSMEITVDGMDFLENNPPSPEGVMSLVKQDSLSKPDAVAGQDTSAPSEQRRVEDRRSGDRRSGDRSAQPAPKAEPLLSVLNRALERSK